MSASPRPPFRLEELRKRKLFQWALAYLAGAWVVLEVVGFLTETFAWPPVIVRGLTVLLAFGFFAALVLAWYHGERGRQRVSGPELLMIAGIFVVAGAAITALGAGDPGAAEAAGEGGIRGSDESRTAEVAERSIAVLPLDDNSPDPDHAYFAAGMTEALTNALQRIPELRVTSRNSAERFPQSGKTVRDFALEDLGVAHVIEGSVQTDGERAQITVQLIDARTDEHLWSETYTVAMTGLLEVQADVAAEVADRLATTLTERERARIASGATDDPLAQDLYLRSLQWRDAGERDAVDRRIGLLREAVTRDPEYAVAWQELGEAFFSRRLLTPGAHWSDSIRHALDRAVETAEDPTLAATARALRVFMVQGGNYEEALDPLLRAAEVDPSDVEITGALAATHWYLGDLAQATQWARRAIRLDPLSPTWHGGVGWLYLMLGLDAQAQRSLGRALEVDPTFSPTRWDLAGLHVLNGRFEDAVVQVDSLRARGEPIAAALEGMLKLWTGDPQGAHETYGSLGEEALDDLYWVAATAAFAAEAVGDTARARRLVDLTRARIEQLPDDPVAAYLELELAVLANPTSAAGELADYVESGGRRSRWIRHDPIFAAAREDPAFEAGLQRLEQIVARQRRQVERDLAGGG